MEKNFDSWNTKKQIIHNTAARTFCYPREIWWCSLGVNIGFEQDGVGANFERPVIVMKTFSKDAFLGAALTSREKIGKYYLPIGMVDERDAFVILSQVRLIDAKRLINKMGMLDEENFEKLKSALRSALFD